MKRYTITFNSGMPILGEYVSDTMVKVVTVGVDDFINHIEFPCRFEFPKQGFLMEVKDKEQYDKVIVALTDERFLKQFKP